MDVCKQSRMRKMTGFCSFKLDAIGIGSKSPLKRLKRFVFQNENALTFCEGFGEMERDV